MVSLFKGSVLNSSGDPKSFQGYQNYVRLNSGKMQVLGLNIWLSVTSTIFNEKLQQTNAEYGIRWFSQPTSKGGNLDIKAL